MTACMNIDTARVFEPLTKPSRYKGAYGGRGSGKSHFMAGAVVEDCLLNPGARIVCIREVQKTLAQSAKRLIESKIQEMGVGLSSAFCMTGSQTPGGGLIIFQGMADATAESIKSLEGYSVAWVEEAQTPIRRAASRCCGRRSALTAAKFGSVEPAAQVRSGRPVAARSRARERHRRGGQLARQSVVAGRARRGAAARSHQVPGDDISHTWEGDYAKAFEGAYFARRL